MCLALWKTHDERFKDVTKLERYSSHQKGTQESKGFFFYFLFGFFFESRVEGGYVFKPIEDLNKLPNYSLKQKNLSQCLLLLLPHPQKRKRIPTVVLET